MSDPRIIGSVQMAVRELAGLRKAAERTATALELIASKLDEAEVEESDQAAS